MPRKPGKVPSYCRHKHSGRAVVRIDGRDRYLGSYGSPESHERYERFIAEWRSKQAQRLPSGSAPTYSGTEANLLVSELILAYWRFANSYYSKDGHPTKELECMREALRPVRRLYGNTETRYFGPKALKAVRQHMVDQGLTRGLINRRVGRIKRVFKWAVAEELVPPSAHHALQAVTGLRYGRTNAREAEPVKPVKDKWVDAVLPYVSPQVSTMIQVQRFTGVRPCELVIMRPCDIDMTSEIWIYEPYDHKNKWRGHDRKIPLGPRAQALLRPFLNREPTAYMFSPREAEEWRHSQRRNRRRSPLTPSQARRRPKPAPKRPRNNRYTPSSYRGAIIYGLKKANKHRNGQQPVPHWFPLQIRHSRGTEVRRKYGLDAAQVALGHARADVTEVYAEKNMELAVKVAREMG